MLYRAPDMALGVAVPAATPLLVLVPLFALLLRVFHLRSVRVYLLWMQRRVYGQSWPVTVLKYLGLGSVYSVVLALAAAFLMVASLARLCSNTACVTSPWCSGCPRSDAATARPGRGRFRMASRAWAVPPR
ncbi:hypothetical protein FHR50_002548 [Xanthomonas arboricola]